MPRKLVIPSTGNCKVWPELLPVEALRQHGRHIYVFRNIKTNQIIYTLYPRLIERNLKQLPFIGKRSVPPTIRPDYWTPFCRVGPFTTPDQGIHALKLLHEYRQLHHLCWKETNPELSKNIKVARIRALMNQKANSVADLARVLSSHRSRARKIEAAYEKRDEEQRRFLDKRWAELEARAKQANDGAIQKLEQTIRARKLELGKKPGSIKASARLNAEIKELEQKLRTMTWTVHIVRRQSQLQQEYEEKYTKAKKNFETQQRKLLKAGEKDEAEQEKASSIKMPKMPINPVRASMLPAALRSKPKPFDVGEIEVQWADLEDATHVKKWPTYVTHSVMYNVLKNRRQGFVTETEWDLQAIHAQRQQAVEKFLDEPSRLYATAKEADVVEAPKKTGIWQYLPNLPKLNPFNRASP